MESRVMVAGVGGGGCNVVAHISKERNDLPDLLTIDTDADPAEIATGARYIRIGQDVMKGMGTGGDPRVGRRAAEADMETVRPLFKNVKLLFIVVGLGGGTGTGAAPLLAEIAREAGALTLCFAMLPFEFEGARRMEQAGRGLTALRHAADAVICMPGQRLFKTIERRTGVMEAFKKADDMIGRGVYAVWREMCRSEGVKGIQLGFDDLRTLIRNGSGRCVFACAEGSGPDKVDAVLNDIRNNPLLNEGRVLSNAHAFLASIAGGPDLSLEEVNRIISGISVSGHADTLIKTGVSCEPSWKEKVFVTVLVSERESDGIPARGGPGRDENDEVDHSKENAGAKAPLDGRDTRAGKDKAAKLKQPTLFEPKKGRFKGVDPTVIGGQNLDIPTFIRRNILIRKPRNNS